MANAKLIEALSVGGPQVTLGGNAEIVALAGLPGDEARRVAEFGWELAYFRGQIDRTDGSYQNRLTVSKPLYGLHPNSAVHFLPEALREQMETTVAELGNSTNGVSPLPTLLAEMKERGGDIDLVVCTRGTGPEDYWRGDAAGSCKKPRGCADQRIEPIDALLPHAHVLAIGGLFDALAEASDRLLSEA